MLVTYSYSVSSMHVLSRGLFRQTIFNFTTTDRSHNTERRIFSITIVHTNVHTYVFDHVSRLCRTVQKLYVMTLPLFWNIFSKFSETANPIAPAIKFCGHVEFACDVEKDGDRGRNCNKGRNRNREIEKQREIADGRLHCECDTQIKS